MGNVIKGIATGGLSMLPGRAGKIATAGLTGGASLLPGRLGNIAGTAATGMPIFSPRGRAGGRGIPALAEEAPVNPALGGGFADKVMPGAGAGLVSQLVNPNVQAAGPNPLLKQVAASVGRSLGRPAEAALGGGELVQAPAAGRQLPKANMKTAQKMNPAEVATRRRVSRG